MASSVAAVIAAEKDRSVSVFSGVSDTDTDDDSVIVFDHRTAL